MKRCREGGRERDGTAAERMVLDSEVTSGIGDICSSLRGSNRTWFSKTVKMNVTG